MNIKDYIVDNFKNDDENEIKTAIDEATKEYDENSLPGLGIFFMLIWENSSEEEKNTILEKIKSNLK